MDCFIFVQIQNLLIVLTVCVQLILMSSGLVHRLETRQEYLDFRAEDIPQAIFYYHHSGESNDFRSRTGSLMDGSDFRLDGHPTFIKFAMVNCSAIGLYSVDIIGCNGGKRRFYAYKPKRDPERFSLRTLYNIDGFLAHMIDFVYRDEIQIIENMNDWESHQHTSKGKKDVVFMHFKGLGSLDHYSCMMFFLHEHEKYHFTLINNEELPEQLGKKASIPNALWFARCSTVAKNSKDPCPVEMMPANGDVEVSTIYSFINLQVLPVVSKMYENGSSIFNEFEHVHILYLFVEDEEQIVMMTEMIENVTKACMAISIQVRGVIADRRVHAKVMENVFGITKDTMLPTAMLETYNSEKTTDMREIEPFTPDEDLVAEALISFIDNVVNREHYFKSIADIYYIHCVKSKDWKGVSDITRDTLIGVCSSGEETKAECDKFKREFRRIVRTMYSAGLLNFDYMYIDESAEEELKEYEFRPSVSLVLQGKFIKLQKKAEFNGMLQWINEQLKINLPILPASGSDRLHLPPQSLFDENGQMEEDNEDLKNYQEDEVAKFASKMRNENFYVDDTLALTDQTFKSYVNMSELLLVLFYSPITDDISFLVQPIIVAVKAEIEKDAAINTIPTKVAKINCEDQYIACLGTLIFPTIRFYSKGKLLGTYNGLLEATSILRTLRLYQQPSLQKLTEDMILKYREPASRMSILGWFATENEDFHVYKKVADEYHGKMKFAYAMGEPTRKLIPEMPQSTFVAAYVQGETSRVLNGETQSITEMRLREFLVEASIPKFGELTMSNFPVYKSFNKSMLILFSPNEKKTESIAWKLISQVVKDDSMENYVFFTWMNMDNSVTKDIRRSYLGTRKEKHADIVIVNHTKGEVYHYCGPQDNVDVNAVELSMWIQKCSYGLVKAKSYLKVLKWKPLREGFDFLHLIDTNQRRAGLSEEEARQEDESSVEEETRRYHSEDIGVEKGDYRSKEMPMKYTKTDRPATLHGMKIPKGSRSFIDDDATVNSDNSHYGEQVDDKEIDSEEIDKHEFADLDGEGDDNLSVDMEDTSMDNIVDEEFAQMTDNTANGEDETNNSRDEL